ncbi:cytochrome P450 736A117-like [Salvia miltiorrhiza]|uniref:cytochrome P450 736A117-like n=1 Tax=Salvia miltiorrhiza TaxID=226208 RepID=UPI0025AD7E68|nr:cytochrome P450 736A117-like [Salvia miltiorrhiza]
MEEFQFHPMILTSLLSLVFLWSIYRMLLKPSSKRKLPPSPPKLPIIGNLHQLGLLGHQDLHSLSQKHGPLMLLHLGSVPALIVSSADSAREITRTHDLIFANRPAYKAFKKLIYGCKNVTLSPYGEYWRQMKSIVVLQVLSSRRVQSFRSIREEETAVFLNKIQASSGPLDLSAMFANFTNDGIGRAAFGRKYSESENGKKFLRVMTDLMELAGTINIGDFIPWLDWIGRLNGFDKRLDQTAKELDEVFETLIKERLQQTRSSKDGEDFLDVLLQIYNDESADASIDRDSVKSLLLDVFVGGTDTISTAMEWTMSEVLRHPKVMEKLQQEVRGIVKEKQAIRDDDLEKMHYLKAVIKEALRFHPPAPLLVPRVATKDVQIKGFDISAGTVVMINVWAIGRDPVSWVEPEKFMPERFLNSSIDFRGHDFELIPFGAGRRGCPGITFAVVAMELLLANLVHKFDWKLANGVEAKDLDMTESPGITVHRATPLLAVASHAT